jgi:hypothetical protein
MLKTLRFFLLLFSEIRGFFIQIWFIAKYRNDSIS